MNLKECLLILLVPLAVIPIFVCLIIFSLFPDNTAAIFIIACLIVVIAIFVSLGIASFFSKSFLDIISVTRKIAQGDTNVIIDTSSSVRDLALLSKSVERMRIKILQNQSLELKQMEYETQDKISRQVAHDIRSPLAALNAVTQDLRELPEEQRIMIRSAVRRIEDISNDLASKKSQRQTDKILVDEKYKVYLLSGIIESIISEKRTQFRGKNNLLIESKLDASSYGLYAKIKIDAFKRVISNLINNAVEALGDDGVICVRMGAEHRDSVTESQIDPSPALRASSPTRGEGVIPQCTVPTESQNLCGSESQNLIPQSPNLSGSVDPSAIFIDDQIMNHNTWLMVAKLQNIFLVAYFSPEDFLKDIKKYDKQIPIYIDSNLAGGVKGEDAAKTIFLKGFKNIYLATGSLPHDFPPMPWIKEVVGKNPPF